MVGLLSKLLIVIIVILAIPTGLVLISQDSVPGDSTYPIKKSLEGVIIAAASLNPVTRAYFNVDFAKRRYNETIKVVKRGDNNTQSLQDLVKQTRSAAKSINQISDLSLKEQYKKDLRKQIVDYQSGLLSLQTDWEKNAKTTQPQITPAPTVSPTPRPTLAPTNAPTTPRPSQTSAPTVTSAPTPASTSTPTPTPTPTSTPAPDNSTACATPDPKETASCLDDILKQILASQGADTLTIPSPTSPARKSNIRIADESVTSSPTPTPTPASDLVNPIGLAIYPTGANQSCKIITGWACDADSPTSSIQVDFWDYTSATPVFLGSVNSDKDLFNTLSLQRACGHLNTKVNHGYVATLLTSVKDNTLHKIRVFAQDVDVNGVKTRDSSKKTLLDTIPTDPNKEIQITCAP